MPPIGKTEQDRLLKEIRDDRKASQEHIQRLSEMLNNAINKMNVGSESNTSKKLEVDVSDFFGTIKNWKDHGIPVKIEQAELNQSSEPYTDETFNYLMSSYVYFSEDPVRTSGQSGKSKS